MSQETVREWTDRLNLRQPLQQLSPRKPWNPQLDEEIAGLRAEELPGAELDMLALKSGLHLWNDNLDRSHTISQDLENPTGSYLHGIMHRMEGDYSNAKYWFHQTGKHPAMEELQLQAGRWLGEEAKLDQLPASEQQERLATIAGQQEWNPFLFIDAVAAQEKGQAPEETRVILEKLQSLELAILTGYCHLKAAVPVSRP
jgi:hypothetical protein